MPPQKNSLVHVITGKAPPLITISEMWNSFPLHWQHHCNARQMCKVGGNSTVGFHFYVLIPKCGSSPSHVQLMSSACSNHDRRRIPKARQLYKINLRVTCQLLIISDPSVIIFSLWQWFLDVKPCPRWVMDGNRQGIRHQAPLNYPEQDSQMLN